MPIYPGKFTNDLFVTAQTAFHHSTSRFITAHFVHHCTLKQALDEATHAFLEFLLSEDEDLPYNLSWGPLI